MNYIEVRLKQLQLFNYVPWDALTNETRILVSELTTAVF